METGQAYGQEKVSLILVASFIGVGYICKQMTLGSVYEPIKMEIEAEGIFWCSVCVYLCCQMWLEKDIYCDLMGILL